MKSVGRHSQLRGANGGQGGGYKAEDFHDLVCQLKPLGLSVLKMDADGRLGGQGGGGAEASVTLEPSTRGRSHLGRPSGRALPGARGTASSGRWRISSAAMPTSTTPTESSAAITCWSTQRNGDFEVFFAPDDFEAEESFEAYVQKMRRPGTWGSQLELMAICQSFQVNAILHQSGLPLEESQCIQLSYHDGEHYNSVRFAWDLEGPVKPLSLAQLKGKSNDLKDLVDQVKYSLPPEHGFDENALRTALIEVKEDVDLAVEKLLNKLANVTDQPSDAAHRSPAAGEGGEAVGEATEAVKESKPEAKPRARAEKRQERKAKADAKKRASRSAVAAQDAAERSDEAIKQLSKQLLTV
eukprot:g31298.t1